MEKKLILQIDGGGAKIVIPAYLVWYIESNLGKKIGEIFHLIAGTSAGAIVCGCLGSGRLTAARFYQIMKNTLPKAFKKKHFLRRLFKYKAKYDRRPLVKEFVENLGANTRMKECITMFMDTSVNMCDGKTHYFKSWEQKDGEINLVEAINRSYAAPFYFGPIVDNINKAVWLDGGTGNANCPIGETLVECVRQGWLQNPDIQVHILSIGCGSSDFSVPFEKAKKGSLVKDVGFYMDPTDGGLARNQSVPSAIAKAEAIAKVMPNVTLQRIDPVIGKKYDKMDGIQYFDYYEQKAKEIEDQIDLNILRG